MGNLTNRSFFCALVVAGVAWGLFSLSWISVWLGLEVAAWCYLAIISQGDKSLGRGALLYFVVSAVSSLLFVVGAVMGGGSFPGAVAGDASEFSLWCLVLASLIKLGCFPFFSWVPMCMKRSGWFSCFMLGTVLKLLPYMVILSLVGVLPDGAKIGLAWVAGLTCMVSAVPACGKAQVKEVMGLSSVFNSGWGLLACLGGQFTFYFWFCFYVLVVGHTMYWASCFSRESYVGSSILVPGGDFPGKVNLQMAVGMASLAGMPPLVGFSLKASILVSYFASGSSWASYGAVVLMMFGSLVSCLYYLRLMVTAGSGYVGAWKAGNTGKRFSWASFAHFSLSSVFMASVCISLVLFCSLWM